MHQLITCCNAALPANLHCMLPSAKRQILPLMSHKYRSKMSHRLTSHTPSTTKKFLLAVSGAPNNFMLFHCLISSTTSTRQNCNGLRILSGIHHYCHMPCLVHTVDNMMIKQVIDVASTNYTALSPAHLSLHVGYMYRSYCLKHYLLLHCRASRTPLTT